MHVFLQHCWMDVMLRQTFRVDFWINGVCEPTVGVLAKDGVIYVLDRIPMPPNKVDEKVKRTGRKDEATVKMLRERLDMEARMEL